MRQLPCLGDRGAVLFQITADGAYSNIPEDVFLRRHYPVKMLRDDQAFSEDQLLEELVHPPGGTNFRGNRIYFIYGVPGSGKSELGQWLYIQVSRHNPKRPIIRITKDELNTLSVLSKLREQTGGQPFDLEVSNKWERFRKSSALLADLLVSKALLKMGMDDPEGPLLSALKDAVAGQTRVMFERIDRKSGDNNWTPQLLSQEDWQSISQIAATGQTQVRWDPVRFHQELVRAWHTEVNDTEPNWAASLQKFCDDHPDTRPVLIIDDVMQALNIFAVELLEAFVDTYDKGRWDVLVGVTPGALRQTFEGQALVNRIDAPTYRDRITHLRLTNESGRESYFVQEDNCAEFLARYMVEYKEMNGWNCSTQCRHYNHCVALQAGTANDARLTPFTPALVQRVFRSIPSDKGRARWLIKRTGEILQRWAKDGISPAVLAEYGVEPNFYANLAAEEENLRYYLNMFGPNPDGNALAVPDGFWEFFGLKGPMQISVRAMARWNGKGVPGRPEVPQLNQEHEQEIIRWLHRSAQNAQQLEPLRRGLSRLVQKVVEPQVLSGEYSTGARGALTMRVTFQGSSPPVVLEGVDAGFQGIVATVGLQERALDLAVYAQHPSHVEAERLLAAPEIPAVVYSAYDLQEQYQQEIEAALGGRSIAGFALDLMVLLVALNGPLSSTPLILSEAVPSVRHQSTRELPRGARNLKEPRLLPEVSSAITQLFEDIYLLRDDLFDGFQLLSELASVGTGKEVVQRLDELDVQAIPDHAYLGTSKTAPQKLRTVIESIKAKAIGPLRHLVEASEVKEVLERLQRYEIIVRELTFTRLQKWQESLKSVAKVAPRFGARIDVVVRYNLREFANHHQEVERLLNLARELQTRSEEKQDPLSLLNCLYVLNALEQNPLYSLATNLWELLEDIRQDLAQNLRDQEARVAYTELPRVSDGLLRLALLGRSAELQRGGFLGLDNLATHLEALGYQADPTPGGISVTDHKGKKWLLDFRPGRQNALRDAGLRQILHAHRSWLEEGHRLVLWMECPVDPDLKQTLTDMFPGQVAVLGTKSGTAPDGTGRPRLYDGIRSDLFFELAAYFIASLGVSWELEYIPVPQPAKVVSALTLAPASDMESLLSEVAHLADEASRVEQRLQALGKVARACDLRKVETGVWVVALENALAPDDHDSPLSWLVNQIANTVALLNKLRVSSPLEELEAAAHMAADLAATVEQHLEQATGRRVLNRWQERLNDLRSLLNWEPFQTLVPISRADLEKFLEVLKSVSYLKPGPNLYFVQDWVNVRRQLESHQADKDVSRRLREYFGLTRTQARLLEEAFVTKRGLPLSQLDMRVVEKLEERLPGISDAMIVVAKTAGDH